jgi:hypothetical protein
MDAEFLGTGLSLGINLAAAELVKYERFYASVVNDDERIQSWTAEYELIRRWYA